jgi:hypothetical protein
MTDNIDINDVFTKMKSIVARNGQLEGVASNTVKVAQQLSTMADECEAQATSLRAMAQQLDPYKQHSGKLRGPHSNNNYNEKAAEIYDKLKSGTAWTQRMVEVTYGLNSKDAYYLLMTRVNKMPGVMRTKKDGVFTWHM